MAVGGGFGGGSFGHSPWGGAALTEETGSEECDLFYFEAATLIGLLSSPITTPFFESSSQLVPEADESPSGAGLGLYSGDLDDGSFATGTAGVYALPLGGITATYTLEWRVILERVPTNFAQVNESHIYFGASNDTGPVAGVLVSEQGLGYTGSVHLSGGNLVFDAPITALPGTSSLIAPGADLTFRLVVDGNTAIVLLYATPTHQVLISGHQLVAILPPIAADEVATPPVDQAIISVKGQAAKPSRMVLEKWCMASQALVANLPPVADAGNDVATRKCAVIQLDGSESFDPEGLPITYAWSLIDGPAQEETITQVHDGVTYVTGSPGGQTDRVYSSSLNLAHTVLPIVTGDVLNLGGTPVPILTTGTDGNGFFLLLADTALPEGATGLSLKLIRQYGLQQATTVSPTFYPTALGFYRFQLIVNDGRANSAPATVVVNVVESPLPRGVTPDLGFMFNYMSDFWRMVEDSDRIGVVWGSMVQILATELYTLWQHEYSKSLADIQRYFIRRWLHYDLLLAEPVPELTSVRTLCSGVTSSTIPLVGTSAAGTVLVLQAPDVHAQPIELRVKGADPFTAADLAARLQTELHKVDPRYSVNVVTRRDSLEQVHITAPFPFSVHTGTTLSVFTVGAESGVLSGTGALKLAQRTVRVDRSLAGLGLVEDDLLVLDGTAYRIATLVDDPADTYPKQRLTIKGDLPVNVPSEWAIGSKVTSKLLNFYSGLVAYGDTLYFQVVDTTGTLDPLLARNELVTATAWGATSSSVGALAFDGTPLGAVLADPNLKVYLAKVVRHTYVPVSSLVADIPTLVQHVQMVPGGDEATLRRNLDFYLETYRDTPCIRFVSGAVNGPSVWEGEVPPDRLWAEYTYLDNNETIEANFGIPAEFTLDNLSQLPGNVDYLSAVRGLWYASVHGPTPYNIRVGAQILLGLPFAEEDGVIEELRTDYSLNEGRFLVRDAVRTAIVRAYTFPNSLDVEINPATGVEYAAGDSVAQFAPLVAGVEVLDYINDPAWWQGLYQQGLMYEVEKFHRFVVRVDSAAFVLGALLLARSFVLRIKPRITSPLFIVRHSVGPTDVDVTDQLRYNIRLTLHESTCSDDGGAYIFDDARPGLGGWDGTSWGTDSAYWNTFDTSQGLTPPTFPVSNPVDWAFDKHLVCPEDDANLMYCAPLEEGPMLFDHVFIFDTPLIERIRTRDVGGPFAVPSGSTGLTLTAFGADTIVNDGTYASVRLLLRGGPGSDTADYELVVAINGTDQPAIAFEVEEGFTEVPATVGVAVTAGDVFTIRVRHADGSTRNPAWTDVRASVIIEGPMWTFDDTLEAGVYCGSRTIT